MSAALVQKSLEIVDPEFTKNSKDKRSKNVKNVFGFIPNNKKIVANITRKGRKEKIGVLSTSKKLTILEAQKLTKTKDEILKQNLNKLQKIREACAVDLDKETTRKIIERAVTRKPVGIKKEVVKKPQETAFTEEDFTKFEEEYMNS